MTKTDDMEVYQHAREVLAAALRLHLDRFAELDQKVIRIGFLTAASMMVGDAIKETVEKQRRATVLGSQVRSMALCAEVNLLPIPLSDLPNAPRQPGVN